MNLIKELEKAQLKSQVPAFNVGDTVEVHVKIVEGDRERIHVFTGIVIGRRGAGLRETFTVRRIVASEGVERVFPLHSPAIAAIKVVRSGEVRRAKLYYLRQRVGKATRVREKLATGRGSQNEPAPEQQPAAEAAAPEAKT